MKLAAVILAICLCAAARVDAGLINIAGARGAPPSSGGGTGSTLHWNAPALNVDGTALSDLTTYRVWYSETQNVYTSFQNVSAPATSYDVSLLSLTSGHTYYFRVTAIDSAGNEGPVTDAEVSWTKP